MKLGKSNLSYKEYLTQNIKVLNNNLSVRTYKRGGPLFESFDRERDYRISIQWKKDPIYQFVVDKSFWNQRNSNNADRTWMVCHADPTIEMVRKTIDEAKKKYIEGMKKSA